MINFSHPIYRYRILFLSGCAALIFTIAYSVIYETWWLLLASYVWSRVVGFVANQIASHRYFAHKTFTTSKWKHKFLLYFSILGGEGSPVSWAITHRHHHKYTETKNDIHSPYESLWLSSLTWQTKSVHWWLKEKNVRTLPRDLLKDKEIRFIDKHYYTIWLLLSLLALAIDWKILVFFLLAPVGQGVVSAFFVNTISHWNVWGSYRNFETQDKSYNNKWVAFYLGGEGLHNNHHYDTSRYNQAFKEDEIDLGGWFVDKFFITKTKVIPSENTKVLQ